MRLIVRRRPTGPTYGEWCAARLRAAQDFAAELASWPEPVDVMRAAWGQIPDVLPTEPTVRRREPTFHFDRRDVEFLNTITTTTAVLDWPMIQ